MNKESNFSISAIITAIILSALAVFIGSEYYNYSINYDIVKNMFFSSLLILIAIIFVEMATKLVLTVSVFSGIMMATGLYIIWMA